MTEFYKLTKWPNFTCFLPENYQKYPNFMIFTPKVNKIPEFYVIFARKMPEFYIIIARKIFFPNFRGGARAPPASPSSTPLWSSASPLKPSRCRLLHRSAMISIYSSRNKSWEATCRRILWCGLARFGYVIESTIGAFGEKDCHGLSTYLEREELFIVMM